MIDNHSDKINVFIPPRLQYQKSEIQKITKDGLTFKSNKTKVDVQVLSKTYLFFLLITQLI